MSSQAKFMGPMVTRSSQDDTSFDSRNGLGGSESGGNGPAHIAYQNFSGKPADLARTGAQKATKFLYVLITAEYAATIMLSINLVPYLVGKLHLGVSYASNLTNYFTGTCFMLSVLGGFISDAYLGQYRTILLSTTLSTMGLIVLIATVTSPDLQPDNCVPTATSSCKAAGPKIMIPTYLGLYLVAAGSGGIKPNLSSFGADQYDDTSPEEKRKSKHFFSYNFMAIQTGGMLALSLFVYLQDHVNRGWGYGVPLSVFLFSVFIFVIGAPRYRHKAPSGSFIFRIVQVFVATFRNRNVPLPADDSELWEIHSAGGYSVIPGVRKIPHTNKLRILDKAATIPKDQYPTADQQDPWRLCTVTQIEETKRILRVVPIWLSTSVIYIFFAQLVSFSVLAASTMDRTWGDNFEFPAGSTPIFTYISSLFFVPFYTLVIIPLLRRYTGHPMGLSPLQRIAAAIGIGIFACIVAALVEEKRLDEIRSRGLQSSPLGTFVLPLTIFYLLPQYLLAMIVEFLMVVGQLEFFYGETSDGVRSIGTSLVYSAIAIGFYMSTVVVDTVNSITSKHYGGSWLEVKVNDGGLKKYWYFLAVLLSLDFLVILVLSHFYEYNPTTAPVKDSSDMDHIKSGRERELTEIQTF